MSNTSTTRVVRTLIGSCDTCASVARIALEWGNLAHANLLRRSAVHSVVKHKCPCGGRFVLKRLNGKVSPDHECDARCQSARGPACECACGGENHGKLFVLTLA